MSLKRIPFTDARKDLSALVDEVRSSGTPIAITKRGKAAAVLVSTETFEKRLVLEKTPWRLRGSGAWVGDLSTVEGAIRDLRGQSRAAAEKRLEKLTRSLADK
jgi:prevent-host-death family protein